MTLSRSIATTLDVLAPRLKPPLRRALRASLLGVARLRARAISPADGPWFVIAPHQDDASLGCGGLIAGARRAGQSVRLLYLTDGSASHPGHPRLTPSDLARRRNAEARLAKARLGVSEDHLQFLDLPDGRLASFSEAEIDDAATRIATILSRHTPPTILLPLRRDGSGEHEAAFELVARALRQAELRCRLLEYPVWALWSPLRLWEPLRKARVHYHDLAGAGALKASALAAYASQFSPTPPWKDPVMPHGFARAFSLKREFFFEFAA